MAQQTPWWWQYYQGQGQQPTPPPNVAPWNVNIPGGPPPGVRQQQAIQAQQYQQQFQNQPDLPPISQQPRTTAPEAPPGQELGSPSPSPTPFDIPEGPPSTIATSPPYYNTPPNETSNFYSDTYQGGGSNPPPIENNIPAGGDQYLYSPPTNEDMAPPQSQSYYGGGFNPAPNEGMTANPYDRYLYDNPPPNETSLPNNAPTYYGGGENPAPAEAMTWTPADVYQYDPNPPPNEEMVANPIDTGPPQDTNRYVPAGDGGQYVYDENWQPGGYQPPPDQPSTTATGENTPVPGGAPTPEPQAPPFTREGSGMMGTWQDYANATSAQTPPPYTSLFDQPSGQNIGAGPLPGSFAGLGSGGGGNLGGWDPFRNLWYGNQPYSPSNFANLTGWENSQGNALAGAQFYPGQTPGPIIYGPTAGGSYSNYLSAWNAVNSPSTSGEADPWGSFGHPSHSGTTSAQ